MSDKQLRQSLSTIIREIELCVFYIPVSPFRPAASNPNSLPNREHTCTIHSFTDCGNMKTTTESRSKTVTTVAARIAGEDIAKGDFVTILSEIIELPSFLWSCSSISLPIDEPVRTRYLPGAAGEPHKIVAVCLPFVYAKRPKGELIAFDTRQQQLVRLDPDSGRSLWKQMRKAAKKKTK